MVSASSPMSPLPWFDFSKATPRRMSFCAAASQTRASDSFGLLQLGIGNGEDAGHLPASRAAHECLADEKLILLRGLPGRASREDDGDEELQGAFAEDR